MNEEPAANNLLPVVAFRESVLKSGKGVFVTTREGQTLMDVNSGQFCAIFGHSDSGVARLVAETASVFQDTDTSTLSVQVIEAAERLNGIAPEMDPRIVLLSTGAEANEFALRYAKHIRERPGVLAFDRGYYGLTHGTAGYSMSRHNLRPPLDHSYSIPAPRGFATKSSDGKDISMELEQLHTAFDLLGERIAAVIVEPILSGAGFLMPPAAYFQAMRERCDEAGIFLIFDECQTGFGRTGTWFYYQQLGVVPDMLVTAKGLGLGYPVSAVLASRQAVPQSTFLMRHFSSHQNEPFSASLVSYGIERIREEDLLTAIRDKGRLLLDGLTALAETHDSITAPRGVGLMMAFDLVDADAEWDSSRGDEFLGAAWDCGLILQHCNFGRTIRLLPSYVITEDEIAEFLQRLDITLRKSRS